MSTGYGWEGIRQVCATLLGARHVPERLCSGPCPQRGAIASARPYLFYHTESEQTIMDGVRCRKLLLFTHICGMSDDRLVKTVLLGSVDGIRQTSAKVNRQYHGLD